VLVRRNRAFFVCQQDDDAGTVSCGHRLTVYVARSFVARTASC
jgi:hypothetical protein